MSLNWEGYMGSTYDSLEPHIRFSKPVKVCPVNRDQVLADFLKHKPNWTALGAAVGGLAYHSDPRLLQRILESAIYPGRLDLVTSLREAYKEK